MLIVPIFLGSLVPTILGSLAYAWANSSAHWILAIITVWMFAAWLAFVAKVVSRAAKMRNPSLMNEIGLAIGLIGCSGQWLLWIVLVSHPGVSDMPCGPMLVTLADLITDSQAITEGFMEALDATGWYDDPDAVLLRSVDTVLPVKP